MNRWVKNFNGLKPDAVFIDEYCDMEKEINDMNVMENIYWRYFKVIDWKYRVYRVTAKLKEVSRDRYEITFATCNYEDEFDLEEGKNLCNQRSAFGTVGFDDFQKSENPPVYLVDLAMFLYEQYIEISQDIGRSGFLDNTGIPKKLTLKNINHIIPDDFLNITEMENRILSLTGKFREINLKWNKDKEIFETSGENYKPLTLFNAFEIPKKLLKTRKCNKNNKGE